MKTMQHFGHLERLYGKRILTLNLTTMKRLLFILATFILCSCHESVSNKNHFISGYFTYHNINVDVIEIPPVPEWGQDYTYTFIHVAANIDDHYHYYGTDESRIAIYNQLAEKYGDIGFAPFADSFGSINDRYAAESISKIELICLEDVGENHPAGSSVAEMFQLESHTPYDFIRSRYTNSYNKRIVKRLDQVSKDDLYLMGFGDSCLFIILPLNQKYNLLFGKKLRLTLNYENQYPITKEFVFEKGNY